MLEDRASCSFEAAESKIETLVNKELVEVDKQLTKRSKVLRENPYSLLDFANSQTAFRMTNKLTDLGWDQNPFPNTLPLNQPGAQKEGSDENDQKPKKIQKVQEKQGR